MGFVWLDHEFIHGDMLKRKTTRHRWFFCGRYWTRTNDLCDVNAAL